MEFAFILTKFHSGFFVFDSIVWLEDVQFKRVFILNHRRKPARRTRQFVV